MKFLKIIASTFHPRSIREKTTLNGSPPVYASHSQKFQTEDEIIDLLKFSIERENKISPGYNQDILVVSSNSKNFKKGFNFLESLNNQKYNYGSIYTAIRENKGYSFGAFDYGFQKYLNNYDFFLFFEDDIVSYHKEPLKKAISLWNETDNCGFVPFMSTSSFKDSNGADLIHCHGGIGMSSSKILSEVVNSVGCLPHHKDPSQNYENQIIEGEIRFTNIISKLGYNFSSSPKDFIFLAPAYDLMRGKKIKKFPNLAEKIFYYFFQKGLKPFIYKLIRFVKLNKKFNNFS
jgi:hypothetical protein